MEFGGCPLGQDNNQDQVRHTRTVGEDASSSGGGQQRRYNVTDGEMHGRHPLLIHRPGRFGLK